MRYLSVNEQELTSRIRASADGELDPEREAELRHMADANDEIQSQLQFERMFRETVARVMRRQVPGAPEGLADRIRRELAAADTGHVQEPAAPVVVGRIRPDAEPCPVTSRRRWWAGGGVRIAVSAAAGVIVITAVLFGVFGRQISGENLMVQTVRWVNTVHNMCIDDPESMRQASTWHPIEVAEENLRAHLRTPVLQVPDLSGWGFGFDGAGKCHLPGGRPSGHLIYSGKRGGDEAEDWASMYVVPNQGQYDDRAGGDLEPLQWFKLEQVKNCAFCVHGIANADGSVVYFLVCPDEKLRPAVMEAVASSLQ